MRIARPIAHTVVRPLTDPLVGSASFTPGQLFKSGEQGAWYDPSDLSTLFQDSAGTTPVTAVGQSVGRILDKSGRGNHASQATSSKRPVLRQDAGSRYYLEFDGVDDSLETAAINFTATDKMTVVAGARKLSDAAEANVASFGISGGFDGTFSLKAPSTAAANYGFSARGTSGITQLATTFSAPHTAVLTGACDFAASTILIRVSGAQTSSSFSFGSVNFSTQILYVGSRGSSAYLNGRIYGLIVRGAVTADPSAAEAWMNGKTGAY